ncbi:MAG: Serine-type D-Ala-D-Ala carboxypeptidase [Herminiimonas sp.]|nr:Serine-type D-Ala-D-Ala carboxypeptidase [Herminiimonas sp.]
METPFDTAHASRPAKRNFFINAILIVLASAGCNTGTGVEDPAPPPSYAAVLRPQIEAVLADTLTSGAVVLVRSPQGDWTEAFGTRARGSKDPVRVTDHFRVGSITKTWTGTVILQLVEEGRISLADPVSRFLPDVPNGAGITIEHLLTMRSGLFNYSTDLAFNQSLDSNPGKTFTIEELLRIAYSHPVYFAPGQAYRYSNTNTLLLGRIIEKLTSMRAEEAFRTRLFAPLGLNDTLMPPLDNTALPEPFARGYQFGTNVETIDTSVLSQARRNAAYAGKLLPMDATEWSTSWGWTAGMGISTAGELAIYARRLVAGGYLDASLQAKRLASCTSTDPSNPDAAGYCWGLAKFGSYYGHTGEIPGYNTFMGHDPVTGTTIVTWAALPSGPDGRPPAIEMARIIMNGVGR